MAALGRVARNAWHLNMKRVWDQWGSTNSNVTSYPAAAAASWHQKVSGYDFQASVYSTKPRGILGFKDALFPSRERTSQGNDFGVDTLDPSDDDDGGEDGDRRRSSRPSHLVRLDDKKVTETAVDKGANVATSALDNVGNVLSKTGLEVQLDVSLQELSIEKLVLKDLGLVLVVNTKPPGSQPEPEEALRETRSGSQPTPEPQ